MGLEFSADLLDNSGIHVFVSHIMMIKSEMWFTKHCSGISDQTMVPAIDFILLLYFNVDVNS